MKKSTFKKIVAVALVVMMLASLGAINLVSAANLTITFAPAAVEGTTVRSDSADASVLTDGVKEGGYNVGLTVTLQGSDKWTDYNLTLNDTIDTIVVYGASPFGGGSWNISDDAAFYALSINGSSVAIESVSVDRSAGDYAIATIKFAATKATSAVLSIKNNVYVSAIYEIEAMNSANAPEVPSEEPSEAPSEEPSEVPSEEPSEAPVASATVYFDNSSYNWAQVYAYVYTEGGGEMSAWPGVAMEFDAATGLYKLELTGDNAEFGKVMFTEANDSSTNRYPAHGEAGLDIAGKDMIFAADHSWTEYVPAADPFDGKYFIIVSAATEKVWKNANDQIELVEVLEDTKLVSEMVWLFELKENGTYRITNKGTGRILDVAYGTDEDGTSVKTWENNDSIAQRFGVVGMNVEGLFVGAIAPACSTTRVVTVTEDGKTQLFTYAETNLAQMFGIVEVTEEDIEDPVEVNYAEGKDYTLEGGFLSGKEDNGSMLTDGVIPEAEIAGQTVAFAGSGKANAILVNLGKTYKDINKVVVGGVVVNGNRQYGAVTIEVSTDGVNFTKVANYTVKEEVVGAVTNFEYKFDSEIKAKFVKVTVVSADYVLTVGEIQVIGSGASEGGSVNPGVNENPGDAGIVVVAVVALMSLAAAVIVSKRRFN